MKKFLKVILFVPIIFLINTIFVVMAYTKIGSVSIFLPVVALILAWLTFLFIKYNLSGFKRMFGGKVAALQGLWKLEKVFALDTELKKYTAIPIADGKNYFEFRGNDFRNGDFDEKGDPLPAEYSPFTVSGDSIVLNSEFFKKAKWQWSISRGRLELVGAKPNGEKARFVFSIKKYSLWRSMSSPQRWITLILIIILISSFLSTNFKP